MNILKKTTLLIFFLTITFSSFSQSDRMAPQLHECNFININEIKQNSQVECDNPDLEYYLKRPPIVTNFTLTEDRNEKIELVLKDEYSFTEIEINLYQAVVIDNIVYQENQDYIMYDDGTHGDVVANDKTFTNNEIIVKYSPTNSYTHTFKEINVIYKESGLEVHSDVFPLRYISVNNTFIDNINMPNVYSFENDDFLFSDHFIYYNKYNNWPELECNQLGAGGVLDSNYIISKSLLYEFWGENVISNGNDKNLYMQVDFINPGGQFLSGQDIGLMLGSLNGVDIHEILHYWIPNITSYLGYDASDAHDGHHANIFRNTSGFLYSSWSRLNGIYCENSLNDFGQDSGGNYLYIDHTTNYDLCNGELETSKDKLYYNDLELYIMNIIPIEDVEFPIISLKNIYNVEIITDPETGYWVGRKLYFDSIYEVEQEQLENAKIDMLNDLGNPPRLDASSPNNFFLTFSGNKSNLSNNEIKMLWILSNDLTTTDEPLRAYSNNNFHKATGELAEITANIPLPLEYTGDFFTTEYIDIFEGEEYQGWTESGVYERILESAQYNDSIVTTHLSVIEPLSINDLDINKSIIYPNPSNDILNIKWNNFKRYTLFDTMGKKIMSSNDKIINVRNLIPGIYFIKIDGILNKQTHYSKILVK